MYYTIYKVTNLLTGKIYIGAHSTSNLTDGYMGSGKYLKAAIKKHGLEQFSREILFIFDNALEMYAKEAEIVTEEFISETNTYNLKPGGRGGCTKCSGGKNHRYWTTDPEWVAKTKQAMLKAYQRRCELGIERVIRNPNPRMPGTYNHTEEAKRKISLANKGKQTGEQNSQFGTCWIHNPDLFLNKKIKIIDLPNYESLGWIKCRKIKKSHV